MTITLTDIFHARKRIAPFVRRTPLARSDWLSERCDADVYLKLESLQLTGAYKARGAVNALLNALGSNTHIVTASAGNHGRAVAYAARHLGLQVTVFVPRSAPRVKVDAIRALGADLRETGSYDDAEREAKGYAASCGMPFLSGYSHADIIAGAGTIGVEIFEDLPDGDVIVVPVGGGGLISGVATAARAIAPRCRIVGVEVEASHAFHASLEAGRVVEVDVRPTLADGLAGNMDPDSITFDIVRQHVDEMVMVGEDALASAMRALAEHERLIVEGAGAVGVAALVAGRVAVQGRRVAVIVTGSNIDLERFSGVVLER